MPAITTFESRFHAACQDLTAEARADLERSFADLKAELTQFTPLLRTFQADTKTALASNGPDVEATVTGLVEKLLGDAAKIGVIACALP